MTYYTRLYSKIIHEYYAEAAEMINNQEDISTPCDVFENTPLHIASEKGSKDIVELLLQNDIDVNAQNKFGETPLHLSMMMGNNEISEILLRNNADPTIKNNNGETPCDQTLILDS